MAKIFLRLEVDFDQDPDVLKLTRYGRDARAVRDLLIGAWRYCKRNTSDGHVPLEQVGLLAYPDAPKVGVRDADRLVECGLAERTDDGYYFPGFLKHNKSRAQIEADAARKAEAGAKGGKVSGQVRAAEAQAKQGASPPRSHSSENRVHSSEFTSEVLSGGERPETLRVVPAAAPPETDETCTRHPDGNPSNEACRGCKRVEERKAQRAARETERAAAVAEAAARDCVICEGGHFVLDADKLPTTRKCRDHRPASSVVVGRTGATG